MSWRRARAGMAAALCLSLLGCAGGTQEDLVIWMAEQGAAVRPRVQPLSEPKVFAPQAYLGAGAVSPFGEEKLTLLLRAETSSPLRSALIAAEKDRIKEPLELVPLDAISMVGTLNRERDLVALVRSDKMLYQVRLGGYMGQNYGRVTAINETQITLREIVQDAAGEWVERTATLQLQEGTRQ